MFNKNKKTSSDKIDKAVAKSVNFELTIADLAKRSERRAWWVAFSAILMALILACGIFYMLPLKEKEPYLVMADAYTGTATVARLTNDINHQRITSSEAVNRSNIAHFILARESYDLALINLRDWTTVLTMSGPGVAAAYTNLYSSQNPDSPYTLYGKDKALRVKILSITMLKGDANTPPKGATVRFQRSLYDKQSGGTRPLDNKIATMAFTYKANLKMEDEHRIENPLGFQVTSYQVENDFASFVPQEVPLAPAPQNAPPANGTPAPDTGGDPVQPALVVPPSPVPVQGAAPTPAAAPAAPALPAAMPAPAARAPQPSNQSPAPHGAPSR